eukprot:Awhi_evm1s7637
MSSSVTALGYSASEAKAALVPLNYELKAEDDEVIVEVECCGVCHSDLHIIDNDWGFLQYPVVVGHEVIGKVIYAGARTPPQITVGTRVGVGHLSRTCESCEFCLEGDGALCLNPTPTAMKPHSGGFSSHVVAQSKWAFPIPDALSSTEAAPLLCGGITTFAPLLAYDVKPGDRVGVIG